MARWKLFLLLGAAALPSCSAAGERRMFAEQFELPSGYEMVNHHVWTGELGKIGGRPVDITVAKPEVPGSAEASAIQLCTHLADGAPIEHQVHEVPADWDTCSFESMEQQVLVGTSARFRSYNEVLADDACGGNRCEDDSLVVWIE
jgi:hypothetical protein